MWERIRKQLWQAITSKPASDTPAPASEEVTEEIQIVLHQNRHLNALLQERPHVWKHTRFQNETAVKDLLQSSREAQRDFLLAAIAHLAQIPEPHLDRRYYPLLYVVKQVLQRRLPLREADIIVLISFFIQLIYWTELEPVLMDCIKRYLNTHQRTKPLDQALGELLHFLDQHAFSPEELGRLQLLQTHLGIEVLNLPLRAGDLWSDTIIEELRLTTPEICAAWRELFYHCVSLKSASPSAKWHSNAQSLIAAIEGDRVSEALLRWFPLVDKPRATPILDDWGREIPGLQLNHHNLDVLRGLVWLTPHLPSSAMARALTALTLSCYRKLPGLGPRCSRVGNAGIGALAAMPNASALEQLALLKGRVRGKQAQQLIQKALDQAAKAQGLSIDELSELIVPSYGFEAVGHGRKQIRPKYECLAARWKCNGRVATAKPYVRCPKPPKSSMAKRSSSFCKKSPI